MKNYNIYFFCVGFKHEWMEKSIYIYWQNALLEMWKNETKTQIENQNYHFDSIPYRSTIYLLILNSLFVVFVHFSCTVIYNNVFFFGLFVKRWFNFIFVELYSPFIYNFVSFVLLFQVNKKKHYIYSLDPYTWFRKILFLQSFVNESFSPLSILFVCQSLACEWNFIYA